MISQETAKEFRCIIRTIVEPAMKTGALFNLDNVTNGIGSCRDLICLHRMYHRIFVAQDQAADGGLKEMVEGAIIDVRNRSKIRLYFRLQGASQLLTWAVEKS